MPRPRSSADLREHVRAAKTVVARALARLQAEPSDEHVAEFEAATALELSKRDELDALYVRYLGAAVGAEAVYVAAVEALRAAEVAA